MAMNPFALPMVVVMGCRKDGMEMPAMARISMSMYVQNGVENSFFRLSRSVGRASPPAKREVSA